MPFSPQQARTLDDALSKLLQTFAEKQSAARPKRCVCLLLQQVCGAMLCHPAHAHPSCPHPVCRWEAMEVRFTGSSSDAGTGLELLEVFCNPNTYKTAFDAKLMITARSAGLKVVCEGRLSNLKADLDAFIKDHCD